MPAYVVRWEIDIDADTPEDAAIDAYNMLPFPGSDSTATVFGVATADDADDPNVTWQSIDIRDIA